jgi:MscS family membrane protein
MLARGLSQTVLLIVLAVPVVAGAQVPSASALKQNATAQETSDDPLGRSTPRGTVVGFIKAAGRGDYDQAINYLNTSQHGNLARELAQQLETILNRETSIDLSKLSRQPEGSQANAQNPNRDLVGVADTPSGKVEIWVDRIQRGDNPPIWLFSAETLKLVPEIYQNIGGGSAEVEAHVPRWLRPTLFSLPLWSWTVLLISLPLILLLGSLAVRLLKPLLRMIAGQIPGGLERHQVNAVVAPLRLILFGVLFAIGANFSATLLGRNFWRTTGMVLIIVGVTWLLMRMIGIGSELTVARLKRIHASNKIALAGLLGRLSQIGVMTIGMLIVLFLAGVNLTAALTGLGIGGLAVAFAAQKTLENLFGGIMIISDRPVRIGDICKIGEVTGTVVDIGLRSTRIRTPERTIVTIPNGQLALMNLENLTLRDKYLFKPVISLRQQTTVDQMQSVLSKIRELLESDAKVESKTARVRFIGIGKDSQDVEIFAYVFAVSQEQFLGIQEDLLLRILDIVESTGTSLALPTQVTHIIQDSMSNGPGSKESASSQGLKDNDKLILGRQNVN